MSKERNLSRRHVLGVGCGLTAAAALRRAALAQEPPARKVNPPDIGTIVEEPREPLTTFLPMASTPLVALREPNAGLVAT